MTQSWMTRTRPELDFSQAFGEADGPSSPTGVVVHSYVHAHERTAGRMAHCKADGSKSKMGGAGSPMGRLLAGETQPWAAHAGAGVPTRAGLAHARRFLP